MYLNRWMLTFAVAALAGTVVASPKLAQAKLGVEQEALTLAQTTSDLPLAVAPRHRPTQSSGYWTPRIQQAPPAALTPEPHNPLPLMALPHPSNPPSSTPPATNNRQTQKDILDYWTPERMRQARPAMPTVPNPNLSPQPIAPQPSERSVDGPGVPGSLP